MVRLINYRIECLLDWTSVDNFLDFNRFFGTRAPFICRAFTLVVAVSSSLERSWSLILAYKAIAEWYVNQLTFTQCNLRLVLFSNNFGFPLFIDCCVD